MTANTMSQNEGVNFGSANGDQQSPTVNGRSHFEDTSREDSPFQSQNSKSSVSESPTHTPTSEEQNARLAALINDYGYQSIRENGQRKWCAPAEWNLPIPQRGSEVFIGKLPRDIYEDELVPLFERCGQIYELRLMMDFSGSNRGYAFVTYTNREDARRACVELNNYEIRRGRHIGVVSSVDNCRLFVGGIPRTRMRDEVKLEMSKLTEGVVDVILYPSAADKTKNRGFAFVEYESHRAAAKARRKLIPNRIQLWGSVIAVDWAEPEQEVDESTMANVKVLYVRNLMVHTTEDTLRKAFERASGTNQSVERVKKMRDFAFVHFATREQALRARDQLNGSELDGAIIEVVLSKPPYQSSIVRSLKNMQKSGNGRTQSVTSGGGGNDDLVTAAVMRQFVNPTMINNIFTTTSNPIATSTMDPAAAAAIQGQQMYNMTQAATAAALTGFPCIDPYANLSQNILERQNSINSQIGNGAVKFTGTSLPPTLGGNSAAMANGRSNRGAAGMRSAGFQAMINSTLRHTAASRRKFSEQFLYDYIMSQQQASLPQQQPIMAQQQALVAPPGGLVIIPNGPGIPYWRPTMTSPTAGYVPVIPSAPFTIPVSHAAPSSVPVVSEPVSVPVTVPVSTQAAVTTVASTEESPPPAQHPIAANTALFPGAQFIMNSSGTGAVSLATFQQCLEDFCRDHGFGIPQYERAMMNQKDASGRDMILYNYKITIPALINTHGVFHVPKVSLTEMEARETAAQYVLHQLGILLTPANASIVGTGFDIFGIPQVAASSPLIVPDQVMNSFFTMSPLYQHQQIRRPMNQQLSVNSTVSPPPATA